MPSDFIFSSESVTAGHPDKLCDQISDAVVDRYLRQDQAARVTAECAVSTGVLFLSVKAQSEATVDAPAAAREVLREVGYEKDRGFDARTCTIMTSFYEVSPHMSAWRTEETLDDDAIDQVTAREQATLFGYACTDTPVGMPLPVWLAHQLARRLALVRGTLPYLSPDGKTQVAVEYKGRRPSRLHGITLIAYQREAGKPTSAALEADLREQVVMPVFADLALKPDAATRIAINPDGPQYPGGPALHAGLTGRKTAVDGYGEFSRQSASALSGKDPSRIDRIGSYAARHAARNVVAAGLADRCEVQLCYSIGLARPVSIVASSLGTSRLSDLELTERVMRVFDFRPAAIVRRFGLRSLPSRHEGSFYRHLATYGQFGRTDLNLPWEQVDAVDALLA